MKADLHLHSRYSDGTESPFEVVSRAAQLRFDVVAITDHDTVAGVAEALEAGRRLGIKVVPGVEITAQFQGRELHLLTYFHPNDGADSGWCDAELVTQLRRYAQNRSERAERIVKRLNDLGVALTMEEVYQQAAITSSCKSRSEHDKPAENDGALGRPHIAAALLAGKHVSSFDEAFTEFLKQGRPAWVDKERADARTVIALVHRAGGIISMAHPGLLRNENIPASLVAEGLDGIEVYHSRHTSAQSTRFRNMAREHGLLITGGSDCHGMRKGEPLMGNIRLEGEDLDNFLVRLEKNHGLTR